MGEEAEDDVGRAISYDDRESDYPEHGDRSPFKCECGGHQTWCAQCQRYSKTCCVPYGTCQCS